MPRDVHSITCADINSDKNVDIVIGSSQSSSSRDSVTLMLNNGSGYFSKICFEKDNMHFLECIDINKDSLPDLITKVFNGYNIVVYLNKGNLTFNDSILVHHTLSDHKEAVRISDMDDDGDKDVVFYLQNSNAYWGICYNDGYGQFSEDLIYSTENVITDLSVGIINNDELPDVLIPGYQAQLFYNYNSSFEESVLDSFPATHSFIVDVDKNSYKDIVLFAHNYILGIPCYMKIFYNHEDENVISGDILEFPNGTLIENINDFNNDGFPDIIFSQGTLDGANENIFISFNNQDGTFSDLIGYYIGIPQWFKVTSADFDNNGYNDIAVSGYFCNETDQAVKVLFNDGTGHFVEDPQVGIDTDEIAIKESKLYQNYPNPFNPDTQIRFDLNQASNVEFTVFNSKGELIRTLFHGRKDRGIQSIQFDASNLNSGIYFYTLATDGKTETRKMLFLK